MADLLKLKGILSLDSTQYEEGLTKAQSALNNVSRVAKVAFAAAGAAAGAFLKASIDTGITFDKSMSQVAATMGTTVDQIQDLSDFAKEMGETTVFSAVEASEALNYMALAGYDAEKSMKMLPSVLDLAASGNIDLARASDMVTDAESALGLTTEEVGSMIDQMAKTASKSNTSVEQLGDAILTIGGTATLMAGGTDRLSTVLGILADNGIKGSEAGTHLRNMLLKLSAPTDDGAKAIQELGLQVFDSGGKMRDMQDIIADLNNAFDGLTDEQKIQYISRLFNARDISSVNALLNTSTERWNELGKAIEDSGGASAEMAHTQLDNLSGDLTLFKSKMEGVRLTVYDSLEPALRNLIKRISDLVDRVDWDKFGKTVGKALGGIVSAVEWCVNNFDTLLGIIKVVGATFLAFKAASFISQIGSIVSALIGLISAAGGVSGAFTALTAVMDANPFVLVATAVVGVVTALALLAEKQREYTDNAIEWENKIDENKTAVDSLSDSLTQLADTRAKAIDAGTGELDHYSKLADELDSLVDENGKVKEGYEDRAKVITGILSDALGTEIEMTDGVIQGYQDIKKSIQDVIEVKKAQLILQAQEQGYVDNINAQREATKLMSQSWYDYKTLKEQVATMEQQHWADWKMLNDDRGIALGEYTQDEIDAAYERESAYNKDIDKLAELRDAAKTSFDAAKQDLAEANYNVEQYESNLAAFNEGAYDKITSLSYDTIAEYQNLPPEVQKIWKQMYGDIELDAATEGAAKARSAAFNVAQGFLDEIYRRNGEFYTAGASMGASTSNGLRNNMQIKSPSRVMRKLGGFVADGYALGIEDEMNEVAKKATELSDTTMDAFNTDFGSGFNAGAGVVQSYSKSNSGSSGDSGKEQPIIIQSVLDGRVIGESTISFIKGRLKAGGALA